MDGDFAEKLKNVLSDPEALSKISAIASGLGAGGIGTAKQSEEVNAESEQTESAPIQSASVLPAIGDRRIALLSSIKPLLREDKRKKIDSLTRALTLAEMMKGLRR
ncbi:MAG: hypothetical protein IJO64_02565 [Clostridia bacterium]|nr:hypothetical protein [Clostridia bacterium]MBQ9847922.1 hypothetical protein [Clostridia bacterium]